MAFNKCSGVGCDKSCFISINPTENPLAKFFGNFATVYKRCKNCGAYYCDSCMKKMGKKPQCLKCKGELYTPGPDEAKKIFPELYGPID
jgi:hypothetical protein